METDFDRRRAISMRLKELREKVDLSQEQVGSQLHRSKQTISKWENPEEQTLPSLEYIAVLCELYECTPEEILGVKQSSKIQGTGFSWRINTEQHQRHKANETIIRGIELFEKVSRPGFSLRDTTFANKHAQAQRALEMVIRSGVITLVDVERDTHMESALARHFHSQSLVKCFVARTPLHSHNFLRPLYTEFVAHLALQPLLEELHQARSFGIGAGDVIARWVELLPVGNLTNKNIYSLMTTKSWSDVSRFTTTPNSLLSRIAYKNPDLIPHPLPFINAERRNAQHLDKAGPYEHDELKLVRDRRTRASNVEVALISVTHSQYDHSLHTTRTEEMLALTNAMSSSDREKIQGELLLRLIDKDGHRVGSATDQAKNNELVYSIELEDLKGMVSSGEKQVWLLNGDPQLAGGVRAAIKGGYVNCIVTTSALVKRLLELK